MPGHEAYLLLAVLVIHRGARSPAQRFDPAQELSVLLAVGAIEDFTQRGMLRACVVEVGWNMRPKILAKLVRGAQSRPVTLFAPAPLVGLARGLAVEQAAEVLERKQVHVDARQDAFAHQVLELRGIQILEVL